MLGDFNSLDLSSLICKMGRTQDPLDTWAEGTLHIDGSTGRACPPLPALLISVRRHLFWEGKLLRYNYHAGSVDSLMPFDKGIQGMQPVPQSRHRTVPSPPKVLPAGSWQATPSPTPASGNHRSCFCPHGFAFSKMFKWNRAACSLLCLALSLSLMHLRFTHVDSCVCN